MHSDTLPANTRQHAEAARSADWLQKLRPLAALAASRGSALVAQFAAQLVVGVSAGAAGLGILQLFTSWTCIAGELLGLGWPTRAMREVAVHCADQRADPVRTLLREARGSILRAWVLLLLVGTPALLLWGNLEGRGPDDYGLLLLGAMLAAPLFSLLRLYADALKGAGAALPAVTLESLTSPVALLLICGICWAAGQPVAALALVATFGISLVVTALALRRALRHQLFRLDERGAVPGERRGPPAAPRGDLFFLWGTGVLSIGFVNLPFLVMPLYVDAAEIGVFAVAQKLVNIVTTLLLILAAVYGPAFARNAVRKDYRALGSLLRRTQLISTAVFLPAALGLAALAPCLAQLFGGEFTGLQGFLCILAAGHLVNAATGLSGVLLSMAGAASRELASLVLALAVALVCSPWVGPVYGATGLALLFSGTIALKNITSYALAIHYLHTAGDRQ